MSKLNRRTILQGLATAPMIPSLAAGAGFRTNASGACSCPTAPASPSLNLVFHGLWAFICWPDFIQAVAPCRKEHSYTAGKRVYVMTGDDVELKQGMSYMLQGAGDGSQRTPLLTPFDSNCSAIFEGKKDMDLRHAYCSVLLPLPDGVYTPWTVTQTPGKPFYVGISTPIQQPSALPVSHVLTYTNYTQGAAALYPQNVTLPYDAPNNDASLTNIHFRAEEMGGSPKPCYCPTGPTQPYPAFEQFNLLFTKLGAHINPYYACCMPSFYQNAAPPGIADQDGHMQMHMKQLERPGAESKMSLFGQTPVNCHSMVVINL